MLTGGSILSEMKMLFYDVKVCLFIVCWSVVVKEYPLRVEKDICFSIAKHSTDNHANCIYSTIRGCFWWKGGYGVNAQSWIENQR